MLSSAASEYRCGYGSMESWFKSSLLSAASGFLAIYPGQADTLTFV